MELEQIIDENLEGLFSIVENFYKEKDYEDGNSDLIHFYKGVIKNLVEQQIEEANIGLLQWMISGFWLPDDLELSAQEFYKMYKESEEGE